MKKIMLVPILIAFIILINGCGSDTKTDTTQQQNQLPELSVVHDYIPDIDEFSCDYWGQYLVNDVSEQEYAYNRFIAPSIYKQQLADYRCSAFKSIISHTVEYLLSYFNTLDVTQILDYGLFDIYICTKNESNVNFSKDISITLCIEKDVDTPHFFIWQTTTIRSIASTGLFATKSENISFESKEIGGRYGYSDCVLD